MLALYLDGREIFCLSGKVKSDCIDGMRLLHRQGFPLAATMA